MILSSLQIQGFRKHYCTKVTFSDSTFLIGENNVGKSSILYALDYLLNNKPKIPSDEYFACTTCQGDKKQISNEIILTAEFNNLPIEAKTWRGFKGRVLLLENAKEGQTGLQFVYRKTFPQGGNAIIETLEYIKKAKPCVIDCKSIQEYIDNGLAPTSLTDDLLKIEKSKKLSAAEKKLFDMVEDIFDVDETQSEWVKNPGGIPQNVISACLKNKSCTKLQSVAK